MGAGGDKPTGIGEFLGVWREAAADAPWWQGTLIRGLRFRNFTDLRPFAMHWAWTGIPPGARRSSTTSPSSSATTAPATTAPVDMSRPRQNLINSFAPVALFDRDYDDQGIATVRDGKYPKLVEGARVERTLILYNDEYRDPTVHVEIRVKSGNVQYAQGSEQYQVVPGEHVTIPYSFQVPNTGGANFEVILSTYKQGQLKFMESRPFRVISTPKTATHTPTLISGAHIVRLGDARK